MTVHACVGGPKGHNRVHAGRKVNLCSPAKALSNSQLEYTHCTELAVLNTHTQTHRTSASGFRILCPSSSTVTPQRTGSSRSRCRRSCSYVVSSSEQSSWDSAASSRPGRAEHTQIHDTETGRGRQQQRQLQFVSASLYFSLHTADDDSELAAGSGALHTRQPSGTTASSARAAHDLSCSPALSGLELPGGERPLSWKRYTRRGGYL
jgi:hypothetical protein